MSEVQLMPETDEELLRQVWDVLDDQSARNRLNAILHLLDAAPRFTAVIKLIPGPTGIEWCVTFVHKDLAGPALEELRTREADYWRTAAGIVARLEL